MTAGRIDPVDLLDRLEDAHLNADDDHLAGLLMDTMLFVRAVILPTHVSAKNATPGLTPQELADIDACDEDD